MSPLAQQLVVLLGGVEYQHSRQFNILPSRQPSLTNWRERPKLDLFRTLQTTENKITLLQIF